MILPLSHEHLLTYVSQKGSLFMTDMRARNDVINHYNILGAQRGIPTCIAHG